MTDRPRRRPFLHLALALTASLVLGVIGFHDLWLPSVFSPIVLPFWGMFLAVWSLLVVGATLRRRVSTRSRDAVHPDLLTIVVLWMSVLVPNTVKQLQLAHASAMLHAVDDRLEAYRRTHDACPPNLDALAAFDGRSMPSFHLGTSLRDTPTWEPSWPMDDAPLLTCSAFSWGHGLCTWYPHTSWFCYGD